MRAQNTIPRCAVVAAAVVVADQAAKFGVRRTIEACSGAPVSACETLGFIGPLRLLRTREQRQCTRFHAGRIQVNMIAAMGLALLPLQRQRLGHAGWLGAVSLGFAGGATGNLLNRVVFGSVTDFIDVGIGIAFNIADVALVTGVLLAVAGFCRSRLASAGASPGASRTGDSELKLLIDKHASRVLGSPSERAHHQLAVSTLSRAPSSPGSQSKSRFGSTRSEPCVPARGRKERGL